MFATDCANVITTLTYLAGVIYYATFVSSDGTKQQCKYSYCYNSFWTTLVPVFCIAVKFRAQFYAHILEPLNISMYHFWLAGSLLLIVGLNIHLLDFYFKHKAKSLIFSPSYWIYNAPPIDEKISLSVFCTTTFGSTTGLEIIHIFLSSLSMICAGWTNHIAWPVSMLSSALALSRSFVIVLLLVRFVVIDQVVRTLMLSTFLLFALIILVGQFYLETSLRNEFQSFRKTTFSHMFLELSLDALQKNLRKPLRNILESKEKFLRIVLEVVSSKRVEFTSNLLSDFDTLNMGNLLLRELYCELDSLHASFSNN